MDKQDVEKRLLGWLRRARRCRLDDRHLRIKKARPKQFSDNGVHIHGIESFWSFTKRRLAKFNGVTKNFNLHLKEPGLKLRARPRCPTRRKRQN